MFTGPNNTLAMLLLALLTATPAAAQNLRPAQEQEQAPAVLTPLAVGNSWTYRSSDSDQLTTDTLSEVREFDGQEWYLLSSVEQGNKERQDVVYEEMWIAFIDGAECDAMSETDERGQFTGLGVINPAYRFPAQAGDTYQPYEEMPESWVEVSSVDEVIETPAGEFTCIVYRETNKEIPGWSFTTYMAPGVGIVRMVDADGDDEWVTELVEYELVEEAEEE